MAHLLRTLVVFTEDMSLVVRTYVALTTVCNCIPWLSVALFGECLHTCRQNTNMHEIKNSLKKLKPSFIQFSLPVYLTLHKSSYYSFREM